MNCDMVFEGGGAKGMVFVGALQEIEAQGIGPARLMGASAGAIMATFLAAGYNVKEMEAALKEEKDGVPVFEGFLEMPPPMPEAAIQNSAFRKLLGEINASFIPDAVEKRLDSALASAMGKFTQTNQLMFFFEYGGFYAGNYFLNWLEKKLNEGIYRLERGSWGKDKPRQFGKMTLQEFHQATGTDLSLIVSDTTAARMLILNHYTAPECPLIWAVRMSMSFPMLWQEVVWDSAWGLYRGKDLEGHTLVDGGMLSNFPIELFISTQPEVQAVMGAKNVEQSNLIGFLIDDAREVKGAPPKSPGTGFLNKVMGGEVRLKTVERIGKLINTMTQAHDKMIIEQYDPFVIHLPAKGFETTEFDMTVERRNALIASGVETTKQYLSKRVFQVSTPAERTRDLGARSQFSEAADRVAGKLISLDE